MALSKVLSSDFLTLHLFFRQLFATASLADLLIFALHFLMSKTVNFAIPNWLAMDDSDCQLSIFSIILSFWSMDSATLFLLALESMVEN